MTEKITWKGRVTSVQPRICLLRSFDQRSHSYRGFVLKLAGELGGEEQEFSVAIGKGAQARHQFEIGDLAQGACRPVENPDAEVAGYYKASGLKVLERSAGSRPAPPWTGCPPDLETYRARGHRRLDARTYAAKCVSCIWGCRMPVEMVIDQWNPSNVRYRRETFCYGPKSCSFYKAGPTRKVPGRKGMVWEEEDWVDEDATAHRGPDD
jgi:hypothetical protein